jgi:hypothetical protein
MEAGGNNDWVCRISLRILIPTSRRTLDIVTSVFDGDREAFEARFSIVGIDYARCGFSKCNLQICSGLQQTETCAQNQRASAKLDLQNWRCSSGAPIYTRLDHSESTDGSANDRNLRYLRKLRFTQGLQANCCQ